MPKAKKEISSGSFSETNLIKFLKMLSKKEMKEFTKFIQSPFHNNRSEVTLFFNEIKKFHPSFNKKSFSKEKIFSKLYCKQKYKDDVIRRLSSNLFKLGENFVAYNNFKKDNFNFEKNILDFYSYQNDDKFFWKQFERVNALLNGQRLRNSEYFHRLSLLNEKEYIYLQKDDPNYKKSGYEKHLESQWKYSIIELLKINSCALIETTYFNKQYEIKHLKTLLKIAEDTGYISTEAIEIYYNIIKLQTDGKTGENFYKTKNLLDKNRGVFDKYEQFNLYTLILVYCGERKIFSKIDCTQDEFDIIKTMVKNGLLTATGIIDPGWFLGAFFRILNANETVFAEKFIEDHKNYLKAKDKEQIINHAYAYLAMHKKDYPKALHYLSLSSYKTENDKTTVNVMRLQVYYEADMHEQFFYTVDSYKHFLKEQVHTSKEQVAAVKAFLSFATKIYRFKLGEINIPLDELKLEITNSTAIGRAWLIEKITELEKTGKEK